MVVGEEGFRDASVKEAQGGKVRFAVPELPPAIKVEIQATVDGGAIWARVVGRGEGGAIVANPTPEPAAKGKGKK